VSDNTPQELSAEEARRLVQWLQNELERQRNINKEMRIAVADLARAFQETLVRAHDAADMGDIAQIRKITIENRNAWQTYLQKIIASAQTKPDSSSSATEKE
jgi:hypothetical protein